MPELWLIAASFFSSTLTAVLGLGGGVLLISLMPGFLPMAAIVPVHGVVQLASNLSRAAFGFRHLARNLLVPFALGSGLGAAIGSRLVVRIPDEHLPLLLAIFILLVTWVPAVRAIRWPGRFFTIGMVQTFISLFVGAAGPLVSPLLLQEGLQRDRLVVTHGAMMSILHGLKVLTFAALGFSLRPHLPLLAAMVAAVTLGSLAGTHLRSLLPDGNFRQIYRILLTILALRLIFLYWGGTTS